MILIWILGTVVILMMGVVVTTVGMLGDGCLFYHCYFNTEDSCRVDAWDKFYFTSEKDCGVDSGDGCVIDIVASCDDDLCYANPKNNSSVLDAELDCD